MLNSSLSAVTIPGAADYLYQYRALCTNSERSVSALWGKLAAEILMQNWDVALEGLNRLKEIIDSKVFLSVFHVLFFDVSLFYITLVPFFLDLLAEFLITAKSAPE
jgi:translation initiation factor 3 subunit E